MRTNHWLSDTVNALLTAALIFAAALGLIYGKLRYAWAVSYSEYTIANDVYNAITNRVKAEQAPGSVIRPTAHIILLGSTQDITFNLAATSTAASGAFGFVSNHISFFNNGPNPCFVKTASNATLSDVPLDVNEAFESDFQSGSASAITAGANTASVTIYARN